jgi:catalase
VREQAEQIVDTMNEIHGVHSGFRAVHAKGLCCKGSFIATAEARAISVAPHLQGDQIPVTVRFSNGAGKPARADGAKDERGLAVKFHLADGASTDMVGLTLPVFFVKTPGDFLALLQAQRPDPATGKPNLDKITAFAVEHPETQRAFGFAMLSMSPASFAQCTFHGIHAFGFTAPDGAHRWIRYRWVPEAGESSLSDDETRALGREYLRDDLVRRLEEASIVFRLELQIGEDGDDPTDPTMPWPEERERIAAGTLTISEFTDHACDAMIFDPGRLTDGIERSDDPILHMRSEAYSVSYERRSSGVRP